MRYRTLGSSGLQVSEIALASRLTDAGGAGLETARACTDAALDAGINLLDTANVYGGGAAEEAWGRILAGRPRDSYVLATKAYFPMSELDWGLSADQVHRQLDASLRRLRTDHVDLFQCHRFDVETPIEETLEALAAVVAQGKARHVGFSEWTPEQIRTAVEIAGPDLLVSSQPQYSLLRRAPEAEVFEVCAEHGISQIVWSPLADGALTGLERLRPIAAQAGLTLAQLALAWVLRRDEVASAIVGAARPEQVAESVAASGVELSADVVAAIDAARHYPVAR